jgi:hypothetical protein
MSKPETLLDLMKAGGCTMSEVRELANQMFNSSQEMKLDGYYVTLPNYDTLAPHIQDFINKAVLRSTIENVLDAHEIPEEVTGPDEDHYD